MTEVPSSMLTGVTFCCLMFWFSHSKTCDTNIDRLPKFWLICRSANKTSCNCICSGVISDHVTPWTKISLFLINFLRTWVLFVGPLIPLFWTSGDICPGFQSLGGSLACMLCHLHAMNSWDSPLVWHLLTSWQPAWQPVMFPSRGRMPGFDRETSCTVSRRALHWTKISSFMQFSGKLVK